MAKWFYRNGTADGRLVNTDDEEKAAREAGYVPIDEIEAESWNGGVPQMKAAGAKKADKADKK